MDQIERAALRKAIIQAMPFNIPIRGRLATKIVEALEPWLAELAALRQSADQERPSTRGADVP